MRVALQRSSTSLDHASNLVLVPVLHAASWMWVTRIYARYIIPTRMEETLTPSSWYQLYFVARRFGIWHGSLPEGWKAAVATHVMGHHTCAKTVRVMPLQRRTTNTNQADSIGLEPAQGVDGMNCIRGPAMLMLPHACRLERCMGLQHMHRAVSL